MARIGLDEAGLVMAKIEGTIEMIWREIWRESEEEKIGRAEMHRALLEADKWQATDPNLWDDVWRATEAATLSALKNSIEKDIPRG